MRKLFVSSMLFVAGTVLAEVPVATPDTPFKLATFDTGGEPHVGLVLGDIVLDVGGANADLTQAENMAAIDIPNGYFDESLGINAPTVGRQLLQQAYLGAKAELGLDATAFFEMGTEGIMDATGLDADQARRANERLASEPILWRDSEGKLEKFSEAMREKGLQCVRGGRFVHLMPDTNKAEAMLSLVKAYRKHWSGNDITSVALGDGPNDIRMLEAADIAVVIPGKHEHDMTLKENNRVLYPSAHGPDGWNEAMLSLLQSDEPESLHNPEI